MMNMLSIGNLDNVDKLMYINIATTGQINSFLNTIIERNRSVICEPPAGVLVSYFFIFKNVFSYLPRVNFNFIFICIMVR